MQVSAVVVVVRERANSVLIDAREYYSTYRSSYPSSHVPPKIWPIIRVRGHIAPIGIRNHIAPIGVRDHIAPGEATCGLGGDGLARGNGRHGLANGSETFRSSD